jgi:hypothetical protein
VNLLSLLIAVLAVPVRPAVAIAPRHVAPAVALPTATVYNGRSRQLAVKPPRIDAAVTVDGVLDEPVWQQAALLNGFSQLAPQDGLPAADSTQVLVWYSPTAIHFGVRAFQPAATVRATLADRDKIAQDDNIQLFLGTFNDGRQATVFMVNPLGVQADGTLVERGTDPGHSFMVATVTREAPDLNPDFVFQSKGHVTDWGYEIEIRIPFKSLRYQSADVQTWGINVVRRVQYSGYEDSWTPALRAAASFLGQSGTLGGLTGLRRGLVVDITPEATQRTEGSSGAAGSWNYDARAPKLGANVRWGLTTNLTLNGTVNPDFSQVEADAGQFNFDPRAALSYPEKRPFFLDGLEQFGVPNSLVYTRRVVQPVAAAKLTGKVGSNEIAFLSAVDASSASANGRDNPVFNIIRLQRDLGSQSRIGMAYTDRMDGANWNRVLDVDGRLVWQRIYALQWQLAGSATSQDGVQANAPLWELKFLRNGKSLSWRSQLTGVDDGFRTQSGFIARAGQVHAVFNPRYTWDLPRGALLEQFSGDIDLEDTWAYRNFTHSGDARDKKLHFNFHGQLRGGWQVGASLLVETFGFDPDFYSSRYRIEVPRPGLPSDTLAFTGTPRIPNRDWVLQASTPQLKFLTVSAIYIWGRDENFAEWASTDLTYASLTADIRASEQLRIGATWQYQDFLRPGDGSRVGRLNDPRIKVEYQVNRNIFVRVIGEYFSDYTNVLRDDSRTNNPLLVYDRGAATWVRTVEQTSNSFRTDLLFSYKPNPGTVFYAGYGAQMFEPEAFAFRRVSRQNDAFFLKASYLFRL